MRKYCPRVRLVPRSDRYSDASASARQLTTTHSFLLSECLFITVTAYQNQLVRTPLSSPHRTHSLHRCELLLQMSVCIVVCLCLCLCVCVLVTTVTALKTAELIDMCFVV